MVLAILQKKGEDNKLRRDMGLNYFFQNACHENKMCAISQFLIYIDVYTFVYRVNESNKITKKILAIFLNY